MGGKSPGRRHRPVFMNFDHAPSGAATEENLAKLRGIKTALNLEQTGKTMRLATGVLALEKTSGQLTEFQCAVENKHPAGTHRHALGPPLEVDISGVEDTQNLDETVASRDSIDKSGGCLHCLRCGSRAKQCLDQAVNDIGHRLR